MSALIGALAAIATLFIKDLYIQVLNENRMKSNTQHEIFRNYAAPLASSAEKLIWRFKEIYIDNRHQFLKTNTLPYVYNEYKRRSTLYRIATMLGWIRAMHLELSALPRGSGGFLTPIANDIGRLQSALADGPHVEVHRLQQICSIWRLDVDQLSEEQKIALATRFEIKLYEFAGDSLKHDSNMLTRLEPKEKLRICKDLAAFLCDQLKRTTIVEEIISETMNQAIAAMSYREALIYRDWQDAIGDSMLELDPDSVRRFKVIGYEKFEEILLGGSLWIEVFGESINDIDFETIDPNDFRSMQLKGIALATAAMIKSLSQTKENDLINPDALRVADMILTAP